MSELTCRADLGLVVRGGQAGVDRAVTWVHGSEIADPTPWLSGGELVLTTGMRLTRLGNLADFVARLVDVGAAGVGFATGVTFNEVPAEIIAAAETWALPVVEVPYETPFVAIAKTVSQRLAAEQRETLQRALDSQRLLIRAALEHGGFEGVVPELARLCAGWCVAADPAGRALVAHPASAASRAPDLADDMRRCRDSGASAMALSGPDDYIALHPLGVRGRVHGFLITGRQTPFESPEHTVVSAAVALLTLELEQARAGADATRRQRSERVEQALRGGLKEEACRRQVLAWGLDPGHLGVMVLRLRSGEAESRVEEVEERLETAHAQAITAATGPGELAILSTDPVAAASVLDAGPRGWAGVSEPATVTSLEQAYRQAQQAASIGRADDRALTRFGELEALQLLLRLQRDDALDTFAVRVLGVIEAHDAEHGDSLLPSLRAFLDHHGSWTPASAALGVHRHTLRARISRAERLLGRSLDSSNLRLELSLALRARDLPT